MDNLITRCLPPHTSLSTNALNFLNSNLSSTEGLDRAPNFLTELRTQCDTLDKNLSNLNLELQSHLTSHSSHKDEIGSIFSNIHSQLLDLQRSSTQSHSDEDSKREIGNELQALAREVARVETVRKYAETALKLDSLVGDIEDAVSSAVNKTLRMHSPTKNSEDPWTVSIRAFRMTEDILSSVSKVHPQWGRLVSAVDHRVDRALAILRPQAIASHRRLLASLGWPPPLSTLNSSDADTKRLTDVQNPLFTMQGDLKHQYCESFIALCGLQEFQRQRKARQLEGRNRDVALHQSLWAIEELVNPISIASQRHFSKWIDKPEFIFALVYKITRDYVDSMDELLQPLVDEAKLSGYSCREEWISAMVSSLSTHLAREIFPTCVSKLEAEPADGVQSESRIFWLNLVDLMIAFDKRVQSLVAHSGISLSLQEGGNVEKISSLSVFCDRPDWLDLWAEIELTDRLDKLKSEMQDDRNWLNGNQGASFLSVSEEVKSPFIASVVLQHLTSVVGRCRALPTSSLRSRFLKLTGLPIIDKFLDCLLLRCQEAEGLTALADDDALSKVSNCVNAARYFESVLSEWCEDIFFLEMGLNQSSEFETSYDNGSTMKEQLEAPGNSIFDEELKRLDEFRGEWVEKLSTVVLRGFDARCRDYIKNKKQWQEKSEAGLTLSRSFVGAMDYLQGKMSVLEIAINKLDFTRIWRILAAGIDKLIFSGILMANVKFYDGGVERLSNDLAVLFGVFGAWCLRPEGFFPRVSEGLKLLKMVKKELTSSLIGDERWLKDNRIRHLTTSEAEKIMKNRVFMR